MLSAVDLAVPDNATWTDQATLVVDRIRDAVTAHPAVVALFLTHRHTSVSVMRCGEVLLRILAALTGSSPSAPCSPTWSAR
jgi:hypothetical protein